MENPEPAKPLRIVVPGGSGQVGEMLCRHWLKQGHHVTVLSRRPIQAPWEAIVWDGRTAGAWTEALESCDACVNLTGRSVNCRYNRQNRAEIYDSRIDSTRLLGQVIPSLSKPPRVWLNASTATIYRHALDRPMDEATGEYGGNEANAPDTWQFSIKVAKDWERAFFESATPGTRKVALRSAMVMGAGHGGVFDVLSSLARRGLGGTIGSGAQYVSWIHEADFARALDMLIQNEDVEGTINIAAPAPLPNRDFMRALREAWGVRLGLPAAEWMIEIGTLLMRTESELVLKSRWVVPDHLQEAGFDFLFPDWPGAARNLVRRMRSGRDKVKEKL